TVLAVLNQIEHQEAPRVTSLRPGVPAELAAIVRRCLAKDPAQRPADARALFAALVPFASEQVTGRPSRAPSALDLSLSDDDVEVVLPPKSERSPWRAMTPRRWAIGAGAIGVAVMAIAVVAQRTRAETPSGS